MAAFLFGYGAQWPTTVLLARAHVGSRRRRIFPVVSGCLERDRSSPNVSLFPGLPTTRRVLPAKRYFPPFQHPLLQAPGLMMWQTVSTRSAIGYHSNDRQPDSLQKNTPDHASPHFTPAAFGTSVGSKTLTLAQAVIVRAP